MNGLDRIADAAYRLVTAADEDEFAHALCELRDEVAEPATCTAYTNTLIGGYVA